MPLKNWPILPLGELTENFDGRRVPVKELDRKSGPYPYYGASGIVDKVDSYLFDGEYLLIGEDGENLRTRQTSIAFIATGKFWVNNHHTLFVEIELLSGGTPKTSEPSYWDGNIPWYSVKDALAETEVWVIDTEKCVTKKGIANSAAQILSEGTTIISARGTVGKLALIGTPMAMNQSCYGVLGIKGYGNFFTYFALQQRTHGTVFDTITRQTFETLDCIFPPANLTTVFDHTVAPLLAQIRANLNQSRTLATLRNTLLPRLLSGVIATSDCVA